jgi:PKD repeat protein
VKLGLQKLALAVLVLLAGVRPALAQNYPFPGKSSASPVNCAGCPGVNASGQLNAGLPTWPYSSPMINHVGRTCDSTQVTDYQGGTGFATARARLVRIVRDPHGSAPPRVYIQMGSAIAVYSLSPFFATELPSPNGLTAISTLVGRTVARQHDPNEKVLNWDAWIFPEQPGSGWSLTYFDGQDKLFDFDIDDRGYVYVATGGFFGWGLVRDNGETGGSLLPLVSNSQFFGDRLPFDISPSYIIAVKAGARYYSVTSGDGGRTAYDVTNPSVITTGLTKQGQANAFNAWARDDVRQRIAIITLQGAIEVYDAAAFVSGGGPISRFEPPPRKPYRDVTADENGNFWTTESTNSPSANNLVKLERGTSGYALRTYDVFGEPFTVPPVGTGLWTINYGDKYLGITGRTGAGGSADNVVKLFKIEGGDPVPVDVGQFFSKYYYKAPSGYAQPAANVGRTMGAYPIKWAGKQYLIYNTQGLGDVFELQAGDSIAVAQKSGTFGIPNPNSKPTAAGPYYGDLLKFTAQSSSATSYALTWNFDNDASGAENTPPGSTGQDGQHQFSGLDTVAKIETVRHVKATANVNPDVNGTFNVTLKVPTARIGIAGTSTALTTDGGALEVVAGDQITDASDGNVEGHYSAWTLGAVTPNQAPDQPLDVPIVGDYALTLAAKYGQYSAFVTNGPAYTDTVSNVQLKVRPFVISFGTPSKSGNAVTFKGSARVTGQASVLSATTWTVEWTLKNGAVDVVPPPPPATVPVGTVPDFTIADRSAVPTGSILQLKVSVSSGLGANVPAGYGTEVITRTLLTPDPKITKSGCDHTSSPCTFTISSLQSLPTTDWTVTWTLKNGATPVASLTAPASQPFSPSLSDPGTYTVSAKAATDLFETTAVLSPPTFEVTGPVCGPPPGSGQIQIYTSCDNCALNELVTMRAESFGSAYTFQGCETYNWTFGDGTAQFSTTAVDTTHRYTSRNTYSIRLTITKGTQTSGIFTWSIKVGTNDPPPPPLCTTPSGIQVTYSGNKGCQTGSPCKTTESVTFTAYKAGAVLQTCDSASWDYGDGGTSSSKSPSHTFTTSGTYTAAVSVSNDNGSANGSIQVPIIPDDSGTCKAPADSSKVSIEFTGRTSGCSSFNEGVVCQSGEKIDFRVLPNLGYSIQSCDNYDWDFGDSTAHSSATDASHSFAGGVTSYHVRLRIYNTTNNTGNIVTIDVPFLNAPPKAKPVLTFTSFPSTGTKGNQVTFAVNSDIAATGWSWNFGDGPADNSQASTVGVSNTISHTYATKGTYSVVVKARNSEETNAAQTSQVAREIVIDDIPEYRYLVPVVAHADGIDSVWRTDVQIYTSDSSVSPSNPLALTASYKGVNYPLNIRNSTMIIQDILNELRPGETEQGSMILSVRTRLAPQIWSRTYNQTPVGTFGQFIPAILLNEAGGGGAVGEGRYYLAGLRSNSRYRTNVGLVNPTALPITAIVRLYDDLGLLVGNPMSRTLYPFQLDQFPVTGPAAKPFSVEVEVPAGAWLIGYASLIDGGSSDPAYIQAIRQSELGSSDYRESVLPGVGHINDWRSDVTIYNPNGRTVTVDLAYYSAAGTKLAEARNIPINAGQFLQYGDLLKEGILGNVADGVGMLRISVPSTVSADFFPLTFARTYNDNGSGKTYGQGIGGFAVNRANVKAGKSALIPAVRSSTKYYTNVGLTNVTASAVTATVKVLDPFTGNEVRSISFPMKPFESIVATHFDLVGRENASLKIEASGGNIWAFASIIDTGTLDPEYVPATPLP